MAICFDAVGSDVMQERGPVDWRVETADAIGAGADKTGSAAERILQRGKVAIDHGLHCGFEFGNRAFLRDRLDPSLE